MTTLEPLPFFEHESSPEWLALKARIEGFVRLARTTVVLAGRKLPWYCIADPEELLSAAVQDMERSAIEVDPFWAATWRSAQGLDLFLARLEVTGKQVLELGCGLGQSGVGAALRGADVMMTDAVDTALMVARLNAWPIRQQIRFRRLAWTQDQLDEPPFPMILGSDIVYDIELFPMIDQCARQHLSPGGRMYLSEPHRHTGDKFSDWIIEAGWQLRAHQVDMQDGRIPIRIFECWLN